MRLLDDSALTVGDVANDTDLAIFAASAAQSGRRLVVGAVIYDGRGRIYVQRRSLTRAVFPGCWDLVGGHAETGESVEQALAREVFEETGWRLKQLGPVVEIIDWEAGGIPRREVDLLALVDGDLEQPRLEATKHTEGRWLLHSETSLLLQGREPDDRWVFKVVERAFEQFGSWPGWPGADETDQSRCK